MTRIGVQYTARKSLAQGMLDMALLLSNVSKMKNLITPECADSAKCVAGMVFLSLSVILQVAVGVMLIILAIREQYAAKEQERKRREKSIRDKLLESGELIEPSEPNSCDNNNHRDRPKMKRQLSIAAESITLSKEKKTMRLNTAVLILVFIIVVINVIIDGMDLSEPPSGVEMPVKNT
ncbi:Hypothetical predicted protein [Mytilus galloprovincialis]|uniref:Uncharacterized protein n=1 Tax=Mytilus galloprovincialis TaxID=29158 RepID=A0A8B6D3E2_MYTGA|nr:Hypothetical predicted protein [Mytilus galloprovincialis]